MLASLDANGWATVIAAVGVVLIQLYGMYLSHKRNAETVAKVDEVAKTLVKQDEKVAEQETKLDTIVKQTDGLLEKFGDTRQRQGELEGADQQRQAALLHEAAVIVAKGQQSLPMAQETVPVRIENPEPVPVVETNKMK